MAVRGRRLPTRPLAAAESVDANATQSVEMRPGGDRAFVTYQGNICLPTLYDPGVSQQEPLSVIGNCCARKGTTLYAIARRHRWPLEDVTLILRGEKAPSAAQLRLLESGVRPRQELLEGMPGA